MLNKRWIFSLCLVSCMNLPSALGGQVAPWQCGLVDSTPTYTPDPEVYPPGKREEPLGCSSKPIFKGLTRRISTGVYNLPEPYDEFFFEACVTHDLCYRHGSYTYGFSRSDCDRQFAKNLKDTCESKILDPQNRKGCLRIPGPLSRFMTMFGKKYYRSTQSSLQGLYCEYLPRDSIHSPRWPAFWAVVRVDGSVLWESVSKGRPLLKENGKILGKIEFLRLQQTLINFFLGQVSDEEVIEEVRTWTSDKNSGLKRNSSIDTLPEVHQELMNWVLFVENRLRE